MSTPRLWGIKQVDVYQTYAKSKISPSEVHTFGGFIVQSSDQGETQVTGDVTCQSFVTAFYDIPLCLSVAPFSGLTRLDVAKLAATNVGFNPDNVIGPSGDVMILPVQISNGSLISFVNDLYAPLNGWATFDNDGNLKIIILTDPRTTPAVRIYDGDRGDWDYNTFKETPPPVAPTVVFANALFPATDSGGPVSTVDVSTVTDNLGRQTTTTTITTTINGREVLFTQGVQGPFTTPVADHRFDQVSDGTIDGFPLFKYAGGSAPTEASANGLYNRLVRSTTYDRYGNILAQSSYTEAYSHPQTACVYLLSTDLPLVNGMNQRAPFSSSGISQLYSDGKYHAGDPVFGVVSRSDVSYSYATTATGFTIKRETTNQGFYATLAGSPPPLLGFISLQNQTGDMTARGYYEAGSVPGYAGGVGLADFNSIYFDFGGYDWRGVASETFQDTSHVEETQTISDGYVAYVASQTYSYFAPAGQAGIGYLFKDGGWRQAAIETFGSSASEQISYKLQLGGTRYTEVSVTSDLGANTQTRTYDDNATPPSPTFQYSAMTSFLTVAEFASANVFGTDADFVQTRLLIDSSSSSSGGGVSISAAYCQNQEQLQNVIRFAVLRATAIRRQITRADDPYLKIGDPIKINDTARSLTMRPHIVMGAQRQFDPANGGAIMAITAEDWVL